MNASHPQYERFDKLMRQVRMGMEQLKNQNRDLVRENEKLKEQLRELKSQDVFSTLGDPERIALRNQVNGLIAKIDQHLNR